MCRTGPSVPFLQRDAQRGSSISAGIFGTESNSQKSGRSKWERQQVSLDTLPSDLTVSGSD